MASRCFPLLPGASQETRRKKQETRNKDEIRKGEGRKEETKKKERRNKEYANKSMFGVDAGITDCLANEIVKYEERNLNPQDFKKIAGKNKTYRGGSGPEVLYFSRNP